MTRVLVAPGWARSRGTAVRTTGVAASRGLGLLHGSGVHNIGFRPSVLPYLVAWLREVVQIIVVFRVGPVSDVSLASSGRTGGPL